MRAADLTSRTLRSPVSSVTTTSTAPVRAALAQRRPSIRIVSRWVDGAGRIGAACAVPGLPAGMGAGSGGPRRAAGPPAPVDLRLRPHGGCGCIDVLCHPE
ncbi:hypothetical protein GCM10027570_46570 [Streptomonospora sediminis]